MRFNKALAISALTLFSFYNLKAQEADTTKSDTSYWDVGGNLNLNFSQVALSNWTGGGESSISLAGSFNFAADYEKGKNSWKNNLDIAYGIIRQGDPKFNDFRKTDDELAFVTKYTRNIKKSLSFSALLDFRTVMTNGYEFGVDSAGNSERTRISYFLNPAYVITSVGVEWVPSKRFQALLSPLTGKTTITTDTAFGTRYGVDQGRQVRQEFGSNLNIVIQTPILKNVDFRSTLNLFSAYVEPAEIDVDWKTQLVLKVNDYLNTTFSTHLIYDEDVDIEQADDTVGPATQFKQVLAVGFGLKF